MKKALFLVLVLATCAGMLSCSSERSVFSDKYKHFRYADGDICGLYHGIESLFWRPYIFIGTFTGESVRNTDGLLYKKFHVTEKIKGDVDDDILIRSHALNHEGSVSDLPFVDGEKYLLITNKENNVYVDEYYDQGLVFCPVDAYEDSFMIVLGEYKHLDFMTTGSKKNFKNFGAFLAYLKSMLDTTGTNTIDSYYYTDSDNIRDIITDALQIMKVKVLSRHNGWDKYSFSNYDCRVEKVYKGDYNLEKGSLLGLTFSGEESVYKGSDNNKHVFFFRFYDSDIDLEKTDEYIICTNSHSLIARKGIVSLDYSEEEIIGMIEEIYGEINILEIPEETTGSSE